MTDTNQAKPSFFPGPAFLLGTALLAGYITVKWQTLRDRIPIPRRVPVVQVGISSRPAYDLMRFHGGGILQTSSSGKVQFELVPVDSGKDPLRELNCGGNPKGMDLMWVTEDYLPILLEKCREVQVIMKVARSTDLDEIVRRQKSKLGSDDKVAVPSYGPGHWILDQQLQDLSLSAPLKCQDLMQSPATEQEDWTKTEAPAVKGKYLFGMALQNYRDRRPWVKHQKLEIVDLLVANKGFLAEYQNELAELVKKWLSPATRPDVARFCSKSDPDKARKMERMFRTVDWSTVADNRTYFCAGPDSGYSPFVKGFQKAKNFWAQHDPPMPVTQSNATDAQDLDVLNDVFSSTEGPNGRQYLCDPNLSAWFDPYDDKLDSAIRTRIKNLISGLDHLEKAKFVIRGSTDITGEPTANLPLSQRRSDAIKNALLDLSKEQRLQESQFDSKGVGFKHCGSDTKEERKDCRRADLFIFFQP